MILNLTENHPEAVEFFERELASFVPGRVFDAHAHLFPPSDHRPRPKVTKLVDQPVSYDEYQRYIHWQLPGRDVSALFIAFSYTGEEAPEANAWVARQVSEHRDCRGLFFARPDDDPEWVRQEVKRLGLHGLKCYASYAKCESYWQADIPDYLPEPMVRVAHEEGWPITLHLVKSRALADPSNNYWVRRYCEKYPDMKLILAHSARGFNPAHNLEGLSKLQGLGNLYFDASVNCEMLAHASIIKLMGHERLMYGSDLVTPSSIRGRNMAANDGFVWVYEDCSAWDGAHGHVEPVLVGLEQLRSLKWACWTLGLNDSQVEDIFLNNAARLFELD